MKMDVFIYLLIQTQIVLHLRTDTDGYQIHMKLVVPNQSFNGAYPTSAAELFRSTRRESTMCHVECSSVGSGKSVFYDTVTSTCSCFEERFEDFTSFEPAIHTLFYRILEACPGGWLFYRNSCYYIDISQHRNMDNSKAVCVGLSSHIVRIETTGENDFLIDAVRQIGSGSFLIGLSSRFSGGHFVWEDTMESPIMTDWDFDQPEINEDCVGILFTHGYPKWHDVYCSFNSYWVICEYDATE